mmetsp:Transcript_17474/g.44758  ORF Transcript_17474/g.44758 Transcript_17474/m.44758 type:complete len:351 (+) Transcript_17474:77-1129(+)
MAASSKSVIELSDDESPEIAAAAGSSGSKATAINLDDDGSFVAPASSSSRKRACDDVCGETSSSSERPIAVGKYAQAPGRPPCAFGASCYRKNPAHFIEEDHPAEHPLISRSIPSACQAVDRFEQPTRAVVPPAPVSTPSPPMAPLFAAQASTSLGSTLRGVPVPSGWGVHGSSLLVWRFMDPQPSSKVAAFDFDGCLAKTSLGGNDPNAWKMQFPHVPEVLAKLVASGHTIVIITNESMDRLKKPEAIASCIAKKCGRLAGFARATAVPLLVLCATAKDSFRKPAIGCWKYTTETAYPGGHIDLKSSFFVGDAAGRDSDHSDSDRAFAQAACLPFFDEKTFFTRRHPPA